MIYAIDKSSDNELRSEKDLEKFIVKFNSAIPNDKGKITDGWGRQIKMMIGKNENGSSIEFVSPGQDGVIGSDDDIKHSVLVK